MSQTYRKRFGIAPNAAIAQEIATLDAQADCQRIVHLLTAYEFSWDIQRALEVALFYTYASDTVSKLLDKTREFSDHGQKRYDDTRLLISHFMESGWDGEVGSRALARINATHGHYRIAQDDFRFVLWTFIEFPIRWVGEFGWRSMTDHEALAWFNFWREIGTRMGISDTPASKADLDAWVDQYRVVHFAALPGSARVAEATLDILRGWLPTPLRSMVAPVVASLLDEPAFLHAVSLKPAAPLLQRSVKLGLHALARVKRVWAMGAYPALIETVLNRTYPGNRYRIEDLEPEHLKQRPRK